MKKLLSIVIALTVLMSAMTVGVTSVSAKKTTPIYSGVLGKCQWKLNPKTETMTVSGSGVVDFDYGYFDDDVVNKTKHIIFKSGITVIKAGKCFTETETLTFPKTLIKIEDEAFAESYNLKSVKIQKGLQTIGDRAFEYCSKLKKIDIPDSVNTIGESAFRNCKSLENVKLPKNLKKIKDSTFHHCYKLKSINLSKFTMEIGDFAFYQCKNLESINLSAKITRLGSFAFYGCKNLKKITAPENFYSYCDVNDDVFNGTAFYKDKSNWSKGELYLGNVLFATDSSIPENYKIKEGTKVIADSAIYKNSKVKSVVVPDSVTKMGSFLYCNNLTSVTLSKNTKNSGKYYECKKLNNIVIPDSVKVIDDNAFQDCKSLKDITLPKNIEKVGYCAFDNSGYYNNSANWDKDVLYAGNCLIKVKDTVKNCTVKDGTKVIAKSVFVQEDESYDDPKLTKLTIPSSLQYINEDALERCYIGEIVVDKNNKNFTAVKGSLYDYRKTQLFKFGGDKAEKKEVLPSTVAVIKESAFSGIGSKQSIVVSTDLVRIKGVDEFIPKVIYDGTYSQWDKVVIESGFYDFDLTCLKKAHQSIEISPKITKHLGDGKFILMPYSDTMLTFKSGNEKVAKVSKDGIVTLTGTGKVTITVNAKESKFYKSDTTKVILIVKKGGTPTPDDDTDVDSVKAKTIKLVKTSPRRGYITFKAPKNVTGYKLYFKSDYKGLVKKYNNTIYTNKYKVNSLKKGMKLTVKIKPFKLSNGKRVYGKVTKKIIIVKK